MCVCVSKLCYKVVRVCETVVRGRVVPESVVCAQCEKVACDKVLCDNVVREGVVCDKIV